MEFWTCSATRQKARRPPFTALRRTTWTGFCPTTAQAHLSTDRQRRNLKKTASEKLSACVCCLFFSFPFFLLFCSSMHNGFTTPDTKLTSGIAFKGQVAAFYKLRNVVFIASHFCILRGASYRTEEPLLLDCLFSEMENTDVPSVWTLITHRHVR